MPRVGGTRGDPTRLMGRPGPSDPVWVTGSGLSSSTLRPQENEGGRVSISGGRKGSPAD